MKMTDVTLQKHYKIGLPNFSNVTVGVSLTWELGEGESMDYEKGWEVINRELDTQAQKGLSSEWNRQDIRDRYKRAVYSQKEEGGGNNGR